VQFLPIAATRQHEMTNILLDQSSVKDVRFSISRDFWIGFPFYESLSHRIYGTFTQWLVRIEFKVKILWDDGETDSPRRRGCASLERRGPRDGRAGAARTSSPPPPSPCGRTSRRARPQRAAQGGAPVGGAVWPSTAASSSRRARRRPWASVAAATARAAAAGVGAAAGVRAAASAPLQWPWRPAEGATRGAAWIACISAKKIAVNRGV